LRAVRASTSVSRRSIRFNTTARLADRARELGWPDVSVIDDDLGRSGSGIHRPGFERLLATLCSGEIGAVFCIEASRLARNGRDWHTLLEFCRLVGTILIDEDGIYDPRDPNDRLLLGMKGTLSEMELSTFRQRSPKPHWTRRPNAESCS
jgi:DNA invertase Pin-like site-specific DNA recombinase